MLCPVLAAVYICDVFLRLRAAHWLCGSRLQRCSMWRRRTPWWLMSGPPASPSTHAPTTWPTWPWPRPAPTCSLRRVHRPLVSRRFVVPLYIVRPSLDALRREDMCHADVLDECGDPAGDVCLQVCEVAAGHRAHRACECSGRCHRRRPSRSIDRTLAAHEGCTNMSLRHWIADDQCHLQRRRHERP